MTIDPQEFGELIANVRTIKELVEKQNGRVSKLEDQVGAIRRWQAYIVGIGTAIGTSFGVILDRFTS